MDAEEWVRRRVFCCSAQFFLLFNTDFLLGRSSPALPHGSIDLVCPRKFPTRTVEAVLSCCDECCSAETVPPHVHARVSQPVYNCAMGSCCSECAARFEPCAGYRCVSADNFMACTKSLRRLLNTEYSSTSFCCRRRNVTVTQLHLVEQKSKNNGKIGDLAMAVCSLDAEVKMIIRERKIGRFQAAGLLKETVPHRQRPTSVFITTCITRT